MIAFLRRMLKGPARVLPGPSVAPACERLAILEAWVSVASEVRNGAPLNAGGRHTCGASACR